MDVVPGSSTCSAAAAAASSLGCAYSSRRSSGLHKPSLLSVHWLRRRGEKEGCAEGGRGKKKGKKRGGNSADSFLPLPFMSIFLLVSQMV